VRAPLDTLLERGRQSERWDARAVEALHRAFERDALPSALVLDTSALSPDEAAERIRAQLGSLA
jgi:chloramphenicol 3-O-phosphotransferase